MTIQQLSQETGIGIDTLRIWERRYGQPTPSRDAQGRRLYTSSQVDELRIVKKLQQFGQRPGKIFAMNPRQRHDLLDRLISDQRPDDKRLQRVVEDMSPRQVAAELAGQYAELGLNAFVMKYVPPLLRYLDHGWTTGQLSIVREHLISDQLENLLSHELDKMKISDQPQLVFLTLCGERHKLGLLLAAVLFQQAGVQVHWLGEELPLSEVPDLATTLDVNGVALSFSSHYASRQAKQDLRSLRMQLDPQIKIIAGGCAVQQVTSLSNLLVCTDLGQIPQLARKHFINGPDQVNRE